MRDANLEVSGFRDVKVESRESKVGKSGTRGVVGLDLALSGC